MDHRTTDHRGTRPPGPWANARPCVDGREPSSGESRLLVSGGWAGLGRCADEQDDAADEEPKSHSRHAETDDEHRCNPKNDSDPADPAGKPAISLDDGNVAGDDEF